MREFLIKISVFFRKHTKVETSHAPVLAVSAFLVAAVLAGTGFSSGFSTQTAGAPPATQTLGASVQAPVTSSQTTNVLAGGQSAESAESDNTAVLGETTPPASAPVLVAVPTPPPADEPVTPGQCVKIRKKVICGPICQPCSEKNGICPLDASSSVRNSCTVCKNHRGEKVCYPPIKTQ